MSSPRPDGGAEVVLGVGGGVGAFKAAALASQLVQNGFRVRVAMTAAATEFVTPLTFAALTGEPVAVRSTAMTPEGQAAHIEWAGRADCMVVAPATADLIARLAAGMADDAVTLGALCATRARIFCPAMNDRMWDHPLVRRNAAGLVALGWVQMGPVEGHLAEGYSAAGRMVEPLEIVARVKELTRNRPPWPPPG
jgi:phosphopantothenoylcysteine decarboxylase/phosphopantothenate--cysteine ligase